MRTGNLGVRELWSYRPNVSQESKLRKITPGCEKVFASVWCDGRFLTGRDDSSRPSSTVDTHRTRFSLNCGDTKFCSTVKGS